MSFWPQAIRLMVSVIVLGAMAVAIANVMG